MNRYLVLIIIAIIIFLMDLYAYQAVRTLVKKRSDAARKNMKLVYWLVAGLILTGYFTYHFVSPDLYPRVVRSFIMVAVFMNICSKLLMILFLFVDELRRIVKWGMSLLSKTSRKPLPGKTIPRSEFLAKSALAVGAVPVVAMSYGIISGAHDYRIRRHTLLLPNLPAAFEGLKIAQLSDIHSGSFFNKTAVKGGVEMLLNEKPDVVFFTGDLVNNEAKEVKGYIDIFSKVSAPLGVFSVLGNHDYGDYVTWPTQEAKQQNFQTLLAAHKQMGWDLLRDEHRLIELNGEKLAILGVENWGARGNFPKYGKLAKAYDGSAEAPVKLLLSHDPSHWDAQVRPEFPDIDVMFAGHTHGMQFGVESEWLKWSPAQYMYDQWAGLYQKDRQQLYVNRGFGYLGFPGRVGMPPEITIFELKKA